MDILIKIIAIIIAVLIAFTAIAYFLMLFSYERLARFYGHFRKTEKENIVKTVQIDRVED
jgi:hypothetical protein